MRYLLDTNVLSEPAKPHPSEELMRRLADSWEEVCTAAPVWHELLYGCRRLAPSNRRKVLEDYLERILEPSLPILPYDAAAATWHAEERSRLVRAGRTPAFVDGQIAAIASSRDLVLVTRNVSDFEGFSKLIVEDWTRVPRS